MAEAFLLLIALLISLLIPVWVYADAQQNSPHSPVLWALVAFFGGLIGLLLYVLLGRSGRNRSGRARGY